MSEGKRPATGKKAPIKIGRLEMEMPHIGNIIGYRAVWVLATVSKDKKRLTGRYFCYCTVMGPEPLWGMYTINGNFKKYFTGRRAIEEAFPSLTWRRVRARFSYHDFAPQDRETLLKEAMDSLQAGSI